MANVPSHSRTRRTHRRSMTAAEGGSRTTHHMDAYNFPLMGAEEVYQQIGIDEAGQITAGQISPGAVTGAAFAASVAPVLLVHGLPTLPDPNYPVDVFVYDIDATPKSLWKNVADVWTRAIGPDDIQANSITAGQIAAGAVSTSELAVGARLVGEVANDNTGSPGVFIDSTGILIRDGQLTLQDEFGETTMEASGFSGSWRDFIALGLYNARFLSGTVGAISAGRTSALPYWTYAAVAGTPVPTFLAGGGVRVSLPNVSSTARFTSDPVPMSGVSAIEYGMKLSWREDAGAITANIYYEVSPDLTFASVSTSVVEPALIVGTSSASLQAVDTVRDKYARVVIEISVGAVSDPDNKVEITEVWFKESQEYLGPARIGGESTPLIVNEFIDPGILIGNGTTNVQIDAFSYIDTTDSLHRGGGTSFPGSPSSGDRFYRTDYDMWFVYAGVRWLCTCPHSVVGSSPVSLSPISATTNGYEMFPLPTSVGLDVYLTGYDCHFRVESGGTALDASNKWVAAIVTRPGGTTVSTLTIDSGSSNVYRAVSDSGSDIVDITSSQVGLEVNWTKTGTPGNLRSVIMVSFRYIAT